MFLIRSWTVHCTCVKPTLIMRALCHNLKEWDTNLLSQFVCCQHTNCESKIQLLCLNTCRWWECKGVKWFYVCNNMRSNTNHKFPITIMARTIVRHLSKKYAYTTKLIYAKVLLFSKRHLATNLYNSRGGRWDKKSWSSRTLSPSEKYKANLQPLVAIIRKNIYSNAKLSN